MTRRILLVNANTTAAMTERMVTTARAMLAERAPG